MELVLSGSTDAQPGAEAKKPEAAKADAAKPTSASITARIEAARRYLEAVQAELGELIAEGDPGAEAPELRRNITAATDRLAGYELALPHVKKREKLEADKVAEATRAARRAEIAEHRKIRLAAAERFDIAIAEAEAAAAIWYEQSRKLAFSGDNQARTAAFTLRCALSQAPTLASLLGIRSMVNAANSASLADLCRQGGRSFAQAYRSGPVQPRPEQGTVSIREAISRNAAREARRREKDDSDPAAKPDPSRRQKRRFGPEDQHTAPVQGEAKS